MLDILKVLLGGVLSLAGTMFVKIWDERRQRLALKEAFVAEIEGLLFAADVRKHEAVLRSYLARWEAGDAEFYPDLRGLKEPPEDPIFTKNADKIGLLGPRDAGDIVAFYMMVKTFRMDMWTLKDGQWKTLNLDQRITQMRALLDMWPKAIRIADRIAGRPLTEAPS